MNKQPLKDEPINVPSGKEPTGIKTSYHIMEHDQLQYLESANR